MAQAVVPAAGRPVVVAPDPALNPVQGPPCVLIIAPHGSYRTFDFIQAAERSGVHTLIASQGRHSVISAYAQGIHLDFSRPQQAYESLLAAIEGYDVRGVIATDDMTTQLAARIAAELNLPHNPSSAIVLTQRKDLARARLQEYQVCKPAHYRLDREAVDALFDVPLNFPMVVKPVSLSASRGVIRVNNPDELTAAVLRVGQMLDSMTDLQQEARRYLLLEEFIDGPEVAVEAILQNGQLQLLTIFDKPEPLNGPFFEETYYIMPSGLSAEMQAATVTLLGEACRAYGISEGPIHAECRIHQGKVYLIEMAARTIGGLCGRLLNVGTGYSLEELVLKHAMNQSVSIRPADYAAGVLMIPIPAAGILKRVEGLLEAQKIPFIDEINIQIREGHELIPLPEGSSYLGFIFAYAPSPKEVEQALRRAHACLNIIIAPLWKIETSAQRQQGTS